MYCLLARLEQQSMVYSHFHIFLRNNGNAFPEELRKGIFPDFKQRVQSLNMFDYSFSNFSLVLCIYLLIFI